MEDAISLAEQLQRHDGDVPGALVDYELDRQPVIERFQSAALESSRYFENVRRYARFEPLQFAFNLLTRSGRITHLELEKRDPPFVSRVDAGLARSPSPSVATPPPVLVPLQIRSYNVTNRVASSPSPTDDARGGTPDFAVGEALREVAATGAGLVLTEFVSVSPEGRFTPGTAGLYADDHVRAWTEIVARAHSGGSGLVVARLGHAGARGATRCRRDGVDLALPELSGWELVSASAVPYGPRSARPRALERGEAGAVVELFRAAVGRAGEAGFDALELDMAHGNLLAAFLSPLTNRREDDLGGGLEGRAALPLAVIDAVRDGWDRPLIVAYSATDWQRGGLTERESVAFAGLLRQHGVDAVHVQAGQTTWRARPEYGRLFLVPYSDVIRNEVGIPTIVGGRIDTRDEVNTIVAAGRADLCLMSAR